MNARLALIGLCLLLVGCSTEPTPLPVLHSSICGSGSTVDTCFRINRREETKTVDVYVPQDAFPGYKIRFHRKLP